MHGRKVIGIEIKIKPHSIYPVFPQTTLSEVFQPVSMTVCSSPVLRNKYSCRRSPQCLDIKKRISSFEVLLGQEN